MKKEGIDRAYTSSFWEETMKENIDLRHVDVELKETVPPDVLYHGTARRFLDSIENEGIHHQSRLYVHLSADKETAEKVGSRHGEPVVLTIDAKKMYEDGKKFYLSNNGVWLTSYVAPQYFKVL